MASFQGFALRLVYKRTHTPNGVASEPRPLLGEQKSAERRSHPELYNQQTCSAEPAAMNQVVFCFLSDGATAFCAFNPCFHWSYGYSLYFPPAADIHLVFLTMEVHFGASQELFRLSLRNLSVPR